MLGSRSSPDLENVKQVMAPGALEPKVKEMLYVAVSIAHGCAYRIHSHTASARAKGMTDQEFAADRHCRHGCRDKPACHCFGRRR